jgi:CheY-like chemotaxis protein
MNGEYLPRYFSPKRALPPMAGMEAGPTGLTPSKAKARILVVEDDYFVGLLIEEALEDAGHEVLAVVTSGEEAVSTAAETRPDLALMDIRLAGNMSGVEAAMELTELGIVSLFATAHSDPATRAAGDLAKPAGWLTKPFLPSEVVWAVERALATLKGH